MKNERPPKFPIKKFEEREWNKEKLYANILSLIEEIEEQFNNESGQDDNKKISRPKINWAEKYEKLREITEQSGLFYEIKAIIYEMMEYQSEFGAPDKNNELIHWDKIKIKIKEALH